MHVHTLRAGRDMNRKELRNRPKGHEEKPQNLCYASWRRLPYRSLFCFRLDLGRAEHQAKRQNHNVNICRELELCFRLRIFWLD